MAPEKNSKTAPEVASRLRQKIQQIARSASTEFGPGRSKILRGERITNFIYKPLQCVLGNLDIYGIYQ